MSFRHIKKSDNIYSWICLILSTLGVAAFAALFFHKEPAFPKAFAMIGLVLFLIGFIWCIRAIMRPYESELVVESDQIRWGRVDRPHRQKSLIISGLVKLVHDKSDQRVLGDVGRWQPIEIGTGILMRPTEQAALVDYLRQNFPNLQVETT